MIKKILTLFVSFLALCSLTSCFYKEYTGKHSDLLTVAMHSILWNNGHSFATDWYKDSEITIIEKDAYGRTMFTYYEAFFSDLSFSSLLICQNADEEKVFYYEDVNFMIKEQKSHSSNLKEFTVEEKEQLKAANDWNLPFDEEKCITKPITRKKPNIPYGEEIIKNQLIERFGFSESKFRGRFEFLTMDLNKCNFIIYGNMKEIGQEIKFYTGLVKTNNKTIERVEFLVPEDPYQYHAEFVEFKKVNDWYLS